MDLRKHPRGLTAQPGERPAHEPGPGPVPPAALRALDLSVRRRVLGLAAGEHRAAALGYGTELAQVRPYEPGDDVRQIDWNVTARMNEPHVRVQVAERVLTTWLVLDISPSYLLQAGLPYARSEMAIILDADLTDVPDRYRDHRGPDRHAFA